MNRLKKIIWLQVVVIAVLLFATILFCIWAQPTIVFSEHTQLYVKFKDEFKNTTIYVNQTTVFNSSMYSVYFYPFDKSVNENSKADIFLVWDFDDTDNIKGDAIGWNVSHIYMKPGKYNVTLTVTCNHFHYSPELYSTSKDSIIVTVI